MPQAQLQTRFLLVGSLLVAAVLEVYPLAGVSNLCRPQWMLLAVLFWMQRRPLQYGLKTAFLAGLLLDIVLGGIPGRYALALCLCAYGMSIAQQRLRHLNLWHHSILVFVLAWYTGAIVLGVDKLVVGLSASGRDLPWSALGTAVLWLLLHLLMPRFARSN